MFKTNLPKGQPRSLRTIAEQQNSDASKFMPDIDDDLGKQFVDTNAGLTSTGGASPADKRPFK